MTLKGQTHEVLTILRDNLEQRRPQLVPSSFIAERMDMKLAALEPTLKVMQGMGVIETDPDLQYNLITREGLAWLSEYNPLLKERQQACIPEWGLTAKELADKFCEPAV